MLTAVAPLWGAKRMGWRENWMRSSLTLLEPRSQVCWPRMPKSWEGLDGGAREGVFADVLVGGGLPDAGDAGGADVDAEEELLAGGELVIEAEGVDLGLLGDGEVADEGVERLERGGGGCAGGDEVAGADGGTGGRRGSYRWWRWRGWSRRARCTGGYRAWRQARRRARLPAAVLPE